MAQPARRSATYEDLMGVPDHLVAEIVDGELLTSPRPGVPHALAASMCGVDIGGPFGRGSGGGGSAPGGWWILDEPELHLGADVVVPDLAGWRRGRLPNLPDGATIELAPDWVCEVTSPRTSRLDRVVKSRVYARAGVTHLWLVDPLGQTLEVYRLEGSHWVVAAAFDGVAPVRAEPFDAVELDLSRWWTRGADRA